MNLLRLETTRPAPRRGVLHIASDPRAVSGVGRATLCGQPGTYIARDRAAGRPDICPHCAPPAGRPPLPRGLKALDLNG